MYAHEKEVVTVDYMEIMDFCSFDTEAARQMIRENYCTADVVEEVLKLVGLEKIQPKSNGA